MVTEVHDVPDRRRFELLVDGERAGLITYRIGDGEIVLVHTEIDPAHQGEGLASVLVRGALDRIRDATELRVVPSCPYAAAWIARHPDYADLTTR